MIDGAAHPGSRRARLALMGLLVAVALLVLGPLPVNLFLATVNVTRDVADFLGFDGQGIRKLDVEKACNILVAIPVGFLLARGWPSVDPRLWFAAALTGSLAVEISQTVLLSGRYGTVLDVVLNATGAALGLLLARSLRPAGSERSSSPQGQAP